MKTQTGDHSLVETLGHDHQQLEELLVKLSEDTDSCDPRLLQETWGKFESCLTRHLRKEEQELLPLFMASHPNEVRSTLSEHQRIRELVAELGVGVDLHTVRKEALLALVCELREHAQAEDRSLYGWLGEGLGVRD